MTPLRRCAFVGAAALAVATLSASPAKAFYGGFRGYGYGFGGFYPGFGAGLALGGLYGGYYPRPYPYYPPVYVAPPVVYVPPPVFLPPPPLVYAEPPPRPRRVVHHVVVHRTAPQCRCAPVLPSTVPAPLRDVPSPGP